MKFKINPEECVSNIETKDYIEPETEVETIILNKLKEMQWTDIEKSCYGDAYYAKSTTYGNVLVEYSSDDEHFNVWSRDGKTHIGVIKSSL
jgi:hypothetical protein